MKKSNKIIIVLLALLIVACLFYVYLQFSTSSDPVLNNVDNTSEEVNGSTNTAGSSAPTTPAESRSYLGIDGVYVVRYTDEGFSPSQLQVPRGESVRFINLSSKGMRISIDDNASPEFREVNQSETVGKNSTYTFSLVREGLMVYYNEVTPSHRANIVVY